MLGTGLAEKSPHVDEARRDNVACAINNLRMRRQGPRRDRRAKVADETVSHENAALNFDRTFWINKPGVDQR
jgi:hypothetical protein